MLPDNKVYKVLLLLHGGVWWCRRVSGARLGDVKTDSCTFGVIPDDNISGGLVTIGGVVLRHDKIYAIPFRYAPYVPNSRGSGALCQAYDICV
jgi:hypothetical protein